MKKGALIVLEGGEGSGKDTQLALLTNWCKINKIKYITTCEPTYGPIGNMIRDIFKGRINMAKDSVEFDHQMAYLFAADRQDHFHDPVDGIQKYLDAGYLVISMRYYFSSYACHCSQPGDFRLVEKLNAAFPQPDLTVFLNIEPEVSMERIQHRRVKDTYEELEKIRLVHNNYLSIFSTYAGELLTIDGTLPADVIAGRITRRIDERVFR